MNVHLERTELKYVACRRTLLYRILLPEYQQREECSSALGDSGAINFTIFHIIENTCISFDWYNNNVVEIVF